MNHSLWEQFLIFLCGLWEILFGQGVKDILFVDLLLNSNLKKEVFKFKFYFVRKLLFFHVSLNVFILLWDLKKCKKSNTWNLIRFRRWSSNFILDLNYFISQPDFPKLQN